MKIKTDKKTAKLLIFYIANAQIQNMAETKLEALLIAQQKDQLIQQLKELAHDNRRNGRKSRGQQTPGDILTELLQLPESLPLYKTAMEHDLGITPTERKYYEKLTKIKTS